MERNMFTKVIEKMRADGYSWKEINIYLNGIQEGLEIARKIYVED